MHVKIEQNFNAFCFRGNPLKLWLAILQFVRDQCYWGEVSFPVFKYNTTSYV